MASIAKRPDRQWRARYRDLAGKEHSRHFARKVDAQAWLDQVTAAVVTGTYVDPKDAKTTVAEWCDTWLAGYGSKRPGTVKQAGAHIARIKAKFGSLPLGAVRPSLVKAWTVQLADEGLAPSYVHVLHGRLSQIMGDAVHDNISPRNPCSRRTSPAAGPQRTYVATTEQVWALYDGFPEHLRPAVLLGAFVGLRTAEVCGLRVADVDFMRGVVSPVQQWPEAPLKTAMSKKPVPIPDELALKLSACVARWGSDHVVSDGVGGGASPWQLNRAMLAARKTVPGLPAGFRFHDLRHFFASLLIASGLDVKVVQTRLRHASAKTTLDTYAHLWPDADESARAAVGAVLTARADFLRTNEASGE